MKNRIITTIAALVCCINMAFAQKLKVCVVGLNHDHIYGILNARKNGQVDIIGIAEPNKELWAKYGKLFNLPDSLFYTDMKTMLKGKKPDAVLGYNAAANHVDIVEVCAPLGIPVMVEKPMAATLDQAKRINDLVTKYKTVFLVNYETTWYQSTHDIYNTVNAGTIGSIKRMVAHDGPQGPSCATILFM